MKPHRLLPLLLPLCGCADIDEPDNADLPVIEAWIDSDGHPMAKFTSSVTPSTDGGELVDKMIRWGKITIADGENEVILTGKRDSRYFPPYIYFSYNMTGTPGKDYRLTATFKSMKASAECHMYEPVNIDRITFEPFEGSDTLRSTMLHFTAPADAPAYFYVTIDGMPALMGWGESTEPNMPMTIPVFNSKQTLEGEGFVAQLRVGTTHVVALHRVSREVFDFWRAYDDAMMFSQNILIGGGGSLPGNIHGGLGIFSARATSRRTIIVP